MPSTSYVGCKTETVTAPLYWWTRTEWNLILFIFVILIKKKFIQNNIFNIKNQFSTLIWVRHMAFHSRTWLLVYNNIRAERVFHYKNTNIQLKLLVKKRKMKSLFFPILVPRSKYLLVCMLRVSLSGYIFRQVPFIW